MSRRSRCAAGLAVATAGVLGLLSACGQSPPSAGTGSLTPGPGQHRLAGMPGGSAAPSMTMPMASPGGGTTAAPVSADTVAIKNFAFSPATLKIKAGTTVTWTNEDTDAHTVTSAGSGGPLHSPALATHGTYTHTFTKPGSYGYVCTIHPFMTGTVEVTS
ncbi:MULTISPECIES: cupredoxin domain-containing protein [Streptomyces]|uniref:cupredoxin domain-containing protein n=1 Tax=Streptomyces TaxID=1883 RepID=UPI001FD78B07|nr:cupredoxin family copper-binding protein [Streptomyces durhamensis]